MQVRFLPGGPTARACQAAFGENPAPGAAASRIAGVLSFARSRILCHLSPNRFSMDINKQVAALTASEL
ncbi:MAG TPA: hypothetical protein VMJ11_18855, partial [Paraburkholderia sp.]|uniref:hypothetical protein n=1 Tax=Paraburkholderia sp. TaxID=1926495 RepID=UPI002B8591AB